MSVNTETNSHVDDAPTATSTAGSVQFSYVKSIDLTEEALEFMDDETAYYDIIKSYTREDKVALFICVGGLISVGAYYESDGTLNEYFRANDASEKQFISIQGWYNDFYGEPVSVDKVLNNVFIGEDLVPLWKVLEDSHEADEAEEESVIEAVEIVPHHVDRVSSYMVFLVTYLTVGISFMTIFGIIAVSLLN